LDENRNSGGQIFNFVFDFFSLMKFDLLILTFLESTREGLRVLKVCEPKFKNGGDITWWANKRITPIILKSNPLSPMGNGVSKWEME